MIEGSRILLVDDNREIVEILSDFLSLNGCTIHAAYTGKEALDILSKKDVEVVILDVKLPDANGIALLDVIKVNNPTTAVIMATGYYDPKFVVEAMKKGAADFLVKPFEFDKLILVMMRVLRERKLIVERENILESLEDKKKIELLNRELQTKIKELTTMYHISNKFNSLSVFDDVYEKMVHIVTEVLDAKSCGYYIVDQEAQELILYRETAKSGNGASNERRISLAGQSFGEGQGGRSYFVRDKRLYLPLVIKGQCIGYMVVQGRQNGTRGNGHYPESDVFFLKLVAEKASTQIENKMLYESLFESVLHTLTSLIAAINKRDSYTEGHCHRVTTQCLALGDAVGISDYERDVLRVVGPIHDLGKIGIPDAILLKPGRLTDEEYSLMKDHSIHGEEIMNRFEILSNEAKIIRHHHERHDGNGYPDGLSGEEIPLCCRILAVCDTYDAMVTNRPYRSALSIGEALREINRCSGSQFDPLVAERFIDMLERPRDDRN